MSIVNILTSDKRKKLLEDPNGIRFKHNRATNTVNHWACSTKACGVRVQSRVSSDKLIGETFPAHDHRTNILKQKAVQIQKESIRQFAAVPGVSGAQMMNTITTNNLQSETPNAILGMSSAKSIKMQLYREKNAYFPKIKRLRACYFF